MTHPKHPHHLEEEQPGCSVLGVVTVLMFCLVFWALVFGAGHLLSQW